jgi:hypothetical protein
MNAHELSYCRHLLSEIRELCVMNEAMSTMLDNPSFSPKGWRTTTDSMSHDPVFQSAVDANFAPYFDRLKRALNDAKVLTDLKASQSLEGSNPSR